MYYGNSNRDGVRMGHELSAARGLLEAEKYKGVDYSLKPSLEGVQPCQHVDFRLSCRTIKKKSVLCY